MRRLIQFLARLYPPSWRTRYGPEFDALLEDASPSARTALNVFIGAFAMQIRTWSFTRIVGMAVLCGVLVVAGFVFTAPRRYGSTSTVKVTASPDASESLALIANGLESSHTLVDLINRFDLYRSARSREPVEDVIDEMRRNLSILPVTSDGKTSAFVIQFTYQDPKLAREVTQDLTARFIDANVRRQSEALAFAQNGNPAYSNAFYKGPIDLQVLAPASLPERPLNPLLGLKDLDERAVFFAILSAALIGTILACFLGGRSGRMQAAGGWTLAIVTFGVSFLIPNTYLSTGVLSVMGPMDVPTLVERALSSEQLTSMIKMFGLYPDQRAKMPVEEIARRMREKIVISPVLSTRGFVVAVSIQFSYSNRFLAQKVTSVLMSRVIDTHVRAFPQAYDIFILDPASLPEHVIAPNRGLILLVALAAGWALGGILALRTRRRPPPAIAGTLIPAS